MTIEIGIILLFGVVTLALLVSNKQSLEKLHRRLDSVSLQQEKLEDEKRKTDEMLKSIDNALYETRVAIQRLKRDSEEN